MGVRKDGITLVDNTGSGSGTPVDIVSPIGPDTKANSIPVTLATDEGIIGEVGLIGGLPIKVVMAGVLDTGGTAGRIYKGQQIMDDSLAVVIASDQTPIPVSGTISVTEPVTVDAVDLDIRNLVFATDKVDVSGSSVTPAANTTTSGTILALFGSVIFASPDGYKGFTVRFTPTAFVGTIKFNVFGTAIKALDLLNGVWVDSVSAFTPNIYWIPIVEQSLTVFCSAYTGGSVLVNIEATLSTGPQYALTNSELALRINTLGQKVMAASTPVVVASDQSAIPVSATDLDIRNLVFATDKVDASGSAVTAVVTGTVTANQGTPNTAVNKWPVSITDGTDTAQVNPQNTTPTDTSNLMIGGYDNTNDKQQPLPILGANWDQSTVNTRAVPVELRATTQTDGAVKTRNELVSVGGIDNAASPASTKLVFSNGNTLAADPPNTMGLQTRQMGHSYATSGNISLVGQRFTVSSRYVVKAAALFKLVTVAFIGTIRPVVSLDNGVNFSYCTAVNIETGVVASSFTNTDVDGTYSIPFGNGATDYGFEVTARTSGSINTFAAANSIGISGLFTIAALNGAVGANVEAVDDDSIYTDGQTNKPIIQTPDGKLRSLGYGLVSADSESYNPGLNRALSLDVLGQLRVVAVPPEQVWQNVNPWESIDSYSLSSPWDF